MATPDFVTNPTAQKETEATKKAKVAITFLFQEVLETETTYSKRLSFATNTIDSTKPNNDEKTLLEPYRALSAESGRIAASLSDPTTTTTLDQKISTFCQAMRTVNWTTYATAAIQYPSAAALFKAKFEFIFKEKRTHNPEFVFPDRLDGADYAILTIQRGPRYEMLAKDLLKNAIKLCSKEVLEAAGLKTDDDFKALLKDYSPPTEFISESAINIETLKQLITTFSTIKKGMTNINEAKREAERKAGLASMFPDKKIALILFNNNLKLNAALRKEDQPKAAKELTKAITDGDPKEIAAVLIKYSFIDAKDKEHATPDEQNNALVVANTIKQDYYYSLIEDEGIREVIRATGAKIEVAADKKLSRLQKIRYATPSSTRHYIDELNRAIKKKDSKKIEESLRALGINITNPESVFHGKELQLQLSQLQEAMASFPESTETSRLKKEFAALITTSESKFKKLLESGVITKSDVKEVEEALRKLKSLIAIAKTIEKFEKLTTNLQTIPETAGLKETAQKALDEAKTILSSLSLQQDTADVFAKKLDNISNIIGLVEHLEKYAPQATALAEQLEQLKLAKKALPTPTSKLNTEVDNLINELTTVIQKLKTSGTITDTDIKTATQAVEKLRILENAKPVIEKLAELETGAENLPKAEGVQKFAVDTLAKIRNSLQTLSISTDVTSFNQTLTEIAQNLAQIETLEANAANAKTLEEKLIQLRRMMTALPWLTKETLPLLSSWKDKLEDLKSGESITDEDINQAAEAVEKLEKLSRINQRFSELTEKAKKLPPSLRDPAMTTLIKIKSSFFKLTLDSAPGSIPEIERRLGQVEEFENSDNVKKLGAAIQKLSGRLKPGSAASTHLNGWIQRMHKLETASITASTVNAAEAAFTELMKLKSETENTDSNLTTIEETCNKAKRVGEELTQLLVSLQSGQGTLEATTKQLEETIRTLDGQIESKLKSLQTDLTTRISNLETFKKELGSQALSEDQIIAKAISLGIGLGIGMGKLAPKTDAFNPQKLLQQIDADIKVLEQQKSKAEEIITEARRIKDDWLPPLKKQVAERNVADAQRTIGNLTARLDALQKKITQYRNSFVYKIQNFFTQGKTGTSLKATEDAIRKQKTYVTAASDPRLLPAATESLKKSQDDIGKLEDKVKHKTSLPSWRRSIPKSTAALTTQPTSLPPPSKKPDEVDGRNGPHM